MKVLMQGNMQYPSVNHLTKVISRLGPMAVIHDITQIAKGLNDYKPDLLIVEEKYIDGVVQAYRHNNKLKIICLGTPSTDASKADIVIDTTMDIPKASIEISEFREDADKLDVSVFCDNKDHVFLTQFLCNNYNVKAYGPVKIHSPKYLGQISDIDTFEILNKSKVSIVFNVVDAQNSILLNTYPISYCKDSLATKTFTDLTSLIECMDSLFSEGVTDEMSNQLNQVQEYYKSDNNFTYVTKILQNLGFNEQVSQLNEIFKEIIQ